MSLCFSSAQLLENNTDSVRLSNQRMSHNASFRTIEVERLTANELFIVSRFCYRSSSRSGVPIGITSTCRCCSLCFQSCGNAIINKLLDGSQSYAGVSDVVSLWYNDEDGDNDANDGDDELDNVVEEEDGERIRFLGGNNSSGTKKYQGSNSSDGGNTGDGVKIKGENTGGIILSLEFSEALKELLSDEAGNNRDEDEVS
ncbi:hypothetical protein Tco_1244151 [Tanacetum coccineum]